MTKIIDEIGRDVNLDRKGIEFLWLITHSYIHNPDKPEFVKPDVITSESLNISLEVHQMSQVEVYMSDQQDKLQP